MLRRQKAHGGWNVEEKPQGKGDTDKDRALEQEPGTRGWRSQVRDAVEEEWKAAETKEGKPREDEWQRLTEMS